MYFCVRLLSGKSKAKNFLSDCRILFQQFFLLLHHKQHALCPLKFFSNHRPYALPQCLVPHQRGIKLRDRDVGLRHCQLDISDEVIEKRELSEHIAQLPYWLFSLCSKLLQGVADTEPRRECVAALHPAKDPRNCP